MLLIKKIRSEPRDLERTTRQAWAAIPRRGNECLGRAYDVYAGLASVGMHKPCFLHRSGGQ